MNTARTIGSALLLTALTGLASCQESLEDRCAREAREYTRKNCPVMVDRNIQMDSMTFDRATHTIGYVYSVKGALDDSLTINSNNPRALLLQQVRNSPNLKLYKEAAYSFRYTYYSSQKKGTKLFEATFHDKDYR